MAIDLHLGRQTRDHADIDVLILRDDQVVMWEVLEDWDLLPLINQELPGQVGEVLPCSGDAAVAESKTTRPKDEADFLAVHPLLTDPQRSGSRRSWARLVSPPHPWLAQL